MSPALCSAHSSDGVPAGRTKSGASRLANTAGAVTEAGVKRTPCGDGGVVDKEPAARLGSGQQRSASVDKQRGGNLLPWNPHRCPLQDSPSRHL